MSDYIYTVRDILERLKGVPEDTPVSFYVDSDASERQLKGMPVLVNTKLVEPDATEVAERVELVSENIKDEWAHREMDLPKSYLLFLVG